jgi:hypothetical protein
LLLRHDCGGRRITGFYALPGKSASSRNVAALRELAMLPVALLQRFGIGWTVNSLQTPTSMPGSKEGSLNAGPYWHLTAQ